MICVRGTRLKSCSGKGNEGHWICFPETDKGCGLADLSDYSWNEDKSCEVSGNMTDAISAASVLKDLRVDIYLWWDYWI